MLMTKYAFFVHQGSDGHLHSHVVRLSDGVKKYFFQCSGTKEGLERFFSSMTDELIEGYFPKPNKKGGSIVDNWAFLGSNPDRVIAEELAFINLPS